MKVRLRTCAAGVPEFTQIQCCAAVSNNDFQTQSNGRQLDYRTTTYPYLLPAVQRLCESPSVLSVTAVRLLKNSLSPLFKSK